ncbi:MAG: hypothetical protein NZ533_01110 [Casimicrobiaceae bacterium]|nr:hypothetical protein [Casimicrobiaceae bacterium]MCX8098445.1 hypothetical protein [Casimicrobiaceae bacterium]MDW8311157.1 hypothetical protein [Burkholderiales bacterium]
MSNVTFTVDENTLRRARILALERGTSVNAMVREFLERTVNEADQASSRAQRFAALVASASIGPTEEGARWDGREALYRSERRYAAIEPSAPTTIQEPKPVDGRGSAHAPT